MRNKKREVVNPSEIFDILNRCDTIRIAIHGDKYPYLVPVSFGMEIVGGKAVLYFHSAQQGMKVDLLRQNPFVCVEGDIYLKTEDTAYGLTSRYESVIGFGESRFLTEPEEIRHGLQLLIEHYGYRDYPLDTCPGMEQVLVGKIVLDEVYGKKNLPRAHAAANTVS